MGWSLPEPRPADPVLGDAASIAALGAALHRAAADVRHALDDLPPERLAVRRDRGRLAVLHARAVPVHESMDRTGARLTEHASELADAIGLARRLVDRASEAGLHVDGPTVSRRQGVHGLADPQREAGREETLRRLQRVLDAILMDLDTERRALRGALTSEHARVRRR